MKKVLLLLFIISAPALIYSQGRYELTVNSFNSEIEISSTATVSVTENLSVQFFTDLHGIYRTIPFRSIVNDKTYRVRLFDFDSDWQFKKTVEGDNVKLRLGDADSYVRGLQDYRIDYKAQNVLLMDDEDYDEFYWNITGNEWEVPIRAVHAVITYPENITVGDNFEYKIYAGGFGETMPVIATTDEETYANSQKPRGRLVIPTVSVTGNQLIIDYQGELMPGEGLTVQSIFLKGMITVPFAQKVWIFVTRFWFVIVTLVWLILSCLIWLAWGKDEKVPVMTEFFPPEKLPPTEADSILKQSANFDIASTLVDLAVRGHIIIGNEEKNKTYVEQVEKLPNDPLQPYESELLKRLFSNKYVSQQNTNRVYTKALTNTFYQDFETIKRNFSNTFESRGFFEKKGNAWRGFYALLVFASIAMIIMGFIFWQNNGIGWLGLLTLIPNIVFFVIMPRKTHEGLVNYQKTLGFKEFLKRAEKDKIEQLFKEDPHYFDATIPYAIIFGFADKWGKVFDGLMVEPPHWYRDPYMSRGGFRVSAFSRNLSRNMGQFGQSMQSRPQSSSGGGSGFSGGGFSGGGFGGGGGGGW